MSRATLAAAVASTVAAACASSTEQRGAQAEPAATATAQTDNPFFAATWDTPYGAPPFNQIKEEHYGPAFDEGMKRHRAEVQAIAQQTEAPTFSNTIDALERSGEMLRRVERVFFNLTATDNNDALKALQEKYVPALTSHYDNVLMDPALFGRVQALYDARQSLELTPEQRKVLADYHRTFIRAGAQLPQDKKERLMEINARLASLYTDFSNRLRDQSANYLLHITNEEDLAGLPEAVRTAAAATAKERGKESGWAFTLVRSSITPFLQYAHNRELRRQIYEAYTSQGSQEGPWDNRAIIKEAVQLRAERAALLGFRDHAHYQIDNNMAKTPAAVYQLLEKLWDGALARAKEERESLQDLLQKDLGADATLQPWDWWYYAEKVRKARYDLSQDDLKPYFQVDAVRQGAFDTATKLFGLTFKEVTQTVPRYHPQVKAFDVQEQDGTHVGLLYVDYHPRPSKRGGAWMSVFRAQSALDGSQRPLVINVGNFPAPAGDKPALLGWDEVETLFHEFGHALHGLLSNVTYPSVAGTRVKRDYVEFPSQLLENWASHPEVIKGYAKHYQTGEPIPDELIAKIEKAKQFNQGFEMTELVAASLLDLEWHTLTQEQTKAISSVSELDRTAMEKLGLIPEINPRYHSPYFQHIFAGDGYSAGYYVYLWAQVLEADAFQAFKEAGNIFDPELAARLRRYVFAAGGSDDEMSLYRQFRGQEPSVDALLRKRGLVSK